MGAEEPDVAPEERDCNGAALGAQGDPTQPHRDELGDAFDLVKRHLTPPPNPTAPTARGRLLRPGGVSDLFGRLGAQLCKLTQCAVAAAPVALRKRPISAHLRVDGTLQMPARL